MTQKEQIIKMLRNATMRTVTCKEFADQFLYHKLASRISELNKDGFEIVFVAGDNTMEGKYTMLFDKEKDPVTVTTETNGQMSFA